MVHKSGTNDPRMSAAFDVDRAKHFATRLERIEKQRTARNGRHYHSLEHAWSEGWRACDAAVSKMDAGRLASGGAPDSPVDGG